MPETILADIAYSGYISLVKFIPFVLFFYLWLLLINWVYFDTKAVQSNTNYWLSVTTIAGAVALVTWMFVPVYVIGLLLFLIIAGTSSLLYVIHRNAKVADFEKVLTIQHFKSLMTNEKKKIEKGSHGFNFVTANGNPIGIPEPKSKESYGFQIACGLFDDAIWRRVSEIKMIPGAEEYTVTYKIDGAVTKTDPIATENVGYFIYFIKHLADLNVEEKRKPQLGSFKTEKKNQKTGWKVQTAGSTAGEQILIVRDEEYSQMDIKSIGFFPEQVEDLKRMREINKGVFIVAGTRASGLTTAFYALLRNHDPFLYSINTVEKRPAGDINSIDQIVFDPIKSGGQTYAQRIQSMVRMGPDIVGVGDCDDPETAKLVCEIAKTKLIYVSIEAENSIQAIAKWLQLVPDRRLALGNLAGLASSRLVRVLCDECKEEYEPNPEMLKKLNIPAGKVSVMCRPGEPEYTRSGKPILCEHCQGVGYYGRTGVLESFIVPENVAAELPKTESLKEIAAILRRNGMKFLQERLVEKIADGVTSINEMVRVLKSTNKAAQSPKKPKA
ncbi:MAG: ATPase, T2SS/T4P/T4SS family [Sedimentisphaeraceae bacterium JB056]